MPQPLDPDALRARALEVVGQMQQFNISHRMPTFTEIEDAVEAALAGLRQDLVTQSLQGQALADFRGAAERPVCPACGATVQAIGQEERQIVTQGDGVVTIERTRGRCSACGLEFFPPG
jgi:YgiT-type zinc finger domain-containing protein